MQYYRLYCHFSGDMPRQLSKTSQRTVYTSWSVKHLAVYVLHAITFYHILMI